MSKDTFNIEEVEKLLGVKGEQEVTVAVHNLTHALGSELLGLMLQHVKEKSPLFGLGRNKEHFDRTTISGAREMKDKLKVIADEVRGYADMVEAGEADIPVDKINEVHIEIQVKGR